jgi:hydrogenase nickel incorporation protein HypA/HybF
MHELSIAVNLVEIAEEEAERLGARVTAVHLRLGALSGVVKQALEAAFEMACYESALRGSRLVVDEVPVLVYCPRCNAERPLPSIQSFRCSVCGEPTPDVRQGREIELTVLEVEQ